MNTVPPEKMHEFQRFSFSHSPFLVNSLTVRYSIASEPRRLDVKVEASATLTEPLRSILETASGTIRFNLFNMTAPSIAPSVENSYRGNGLMIRSEELGILLNFAERTKDSQLLSELARDLIQALNRIAAGDLNSANEILESWAETAEICLDPEMMAMIKRGHEEAESGRGKLWWPRTPSN